MVCVEFTFRLTHLLRQKCPFSKGETRGGMQSIIIGLAPYTLYRLASHKLFLNKIKFIIDVFKTYSNRIIEVEDNSPLYEEQI